MYHHLGAEGPGFPQHKALRMEFRHSKYQRAVCNFLSNKFILACIRKFFHLETLKALHDNPHAFRLYEIHHKIEHRFMLDYNHCAKMWVKIDAQHAFPIQEGTEERNSYCAYELMVPNLDKVKVDEAKLDQVPMRLGAWDIEALSRALRFPNPLTKGDWPYTISTNYKVTNSVDEWKISIFMSNCIQDIFDVENKRIRFVVPKGDFGMFYDLIQSMIYVLDLDSPIAYNSSKFDYPYLYSYAATEGLIASKPDLRFDDAFIYSPLDSDVFPKWGMFSRKRGHFCEAKTVLRKSNQMGAQENTRVIIPGRINVDLLVEVQQLFKAKSYSLAAMAKKEGVDMEKYDLSPQEQFAHYLSDDTANHEEIDKYCSIDCAIPQKMMSFFNPIQKYCESSRCNWLNVEDQMWQVRILTHHYILEVRLKEVSHRLFCFVLFLCMCWCECIGPADTSVPKLHQGTTEQEMVQGALSHAFQWRARRRRGRVGRVQPEGVQRGRGRGRRGRVLQFSKGPVLLGHALRL
jgi:DNA polymerase elongation subunit (family B)